MISDLDLKQQGWYSSFMERNIFSLASALSRADHLDIKYYPIDCYFYASNWSR